MFLLKETSTKKKPMFYEMVEPTYMYRESLKQLEEDK
jgi:hypothetical protein